MALHRSTCAVLFFSLALWLTASCSEPASENQLEPENQLNSGDPPVVEINERPEARTNEISAHFSFRCLDEVECTYLCSLDDGASEPCDSPISYENLDDGEHVFEVIALDGFDQESEPSVWTWIIDTVAPTIIGFTGPPNFTNEADATFTFDCSKENCSFECALDDTSFRECESPVSYEALEDGTYIFSLRPTDDLGNAGEIFTHQWTIDRVNPLVLNLQGPEALTNQTSATFEFDCSEEDCTFSCQLNDTAPESCAPGVTFDELDARDHVLIIFATNEAGISGPPAQWSWTVDTAAPEVALSATIEGASATFEFDCTNKPSCSFECALAYDFGENDWEMGLWEACSSPNNIDGLEAGSYEFFVEATDGAGNQTRESYQWTLVPRSWLVASAGTDHTCGIATDSSLWCWGNGESGKLGLGDTNLRRRAQQVLPGDPDLATGWESLSAGTSHTCATRTDGSLWCWGSGSFGQLGLGNSSGHSTPQQVFASDSNLATGWERVSAGGFHTCAIRTSGSLWCWGAGESGQLGMDSNTNENTPQQIFSDDLNLSTGWERLATGVGHVCATRTDSTLWCWGFGQSGRLGLGDTTNRSTPRQVLASDTSLATGWEQVFAGNHTCATRTDGSLWCWGAGSRGQLGLGTTTAQTLPQQVSSGAPGLPGGWDTVDLGGEHTCATGSDASLWCWGSGANGQLGLGDTADQTTPQRLFSGDPELTSGWDSVYLGGSHTCALQSNGQMRCWGNRYSGQLGDGVDGGDKSAPSSMDINVDLLGIDAGWSHGCGIAVDSSLWCWGDGSLGQLGLGDRNNQKKPQPVPAGDPDLATGWSRIGLGRNHTCATRTDGSLWCWGAGINGRLGLGDLALQVSPQQVLAGDSDLAIGWDRVSAGENHTCATRTDGSLWCWGAGESGQLGLGNTNQQTTPQQVYADHSDLATGWVQIDLGISHTCATRTDGSLWCWGRGSLGQLGLGGTSNQSTPQKVLEGDPDLAMGWEQLSAGGNHTCATRTDGSLWCWGQGQSGRLGLGDTTNRTAPQQVLANDPDFATGWEKLSAGGSHTCATRTDGSLWCWGNGAFGQLGLSNTSLQTTPQKLGTALTWTAIAAGGEHTQGLRNTGEVWSWGRNGSGQLGDGLLWSEEPILLVAF